jgi:glycosyltransferase involved in cell wall biosynthesis
LISIIVPAFNAEKTIKSCIESILQQEFEEEFELIVVDDGSKDNTATIAKSFKEVKILQQKNSGPAVARNNGAKQARGEIIVFTDSDCIAAQDWLREMIAPFAEKKIVAVQGAYKTKQKSLIARFEQTDIEYRYERMKRVKSLDWIGSYSAAFRKKTFLDFGGFDESFPIASGEDPELSYRIAMSGAKLVFNPKAIVFHLHPDKLSKYLRTKFFRAYWRVLLYKKHPEKAVNDSYTPQMLKLQIPLSLLLVFSILLLQAQPIIFAIVLFLFLATNANFFIFAAKKELSIAIIAPVIIFLRSIIFATGLIVGTIKAVKK